MTRGGKIGSFLKSEDTCFAFALILSRSRVHLVSFSVTEKSSMMHKVEVFRFLEFFSFLKNSDQLVSILSVSAFFAFLISFVPIFCHYHHFRDFDNYRQENNLNWGEREEIPWLNSGFFSGVGGRGSFCLFQYFCFVFL